MLLICSVDKSWTRARPSSSSSQPLKNENFGIFWIYNNHILLRTCLSCLDHFCMRQIQDIYTIYGKNNISNFEATRFCRSIWLNGGNHNRTRSVNSKSKFATYTQNLYRFITLWKKNDEIVWYIIFFVNQQIFKIKFAKSMYPLPIILVSTYQMFVQVFDYTSLRWISCVPSDG